MRLSTTTIALTVALPAVPAFALPAQIPSNSGTAHPGQPGHTAGSPRSTVSARRTGAAGADPDAAGRGRRRHAPRHHGGGGTGSAGGVAAGVIASAKATAGLSLATKATLVVAVGATVAGGAVTRSRRCGRPRPSTPARTRRRRRARLPGAPRPPRRAR